MGMDHGIWMAIAGCYGDETCISIGDMGILYDIMGFLQTTICECIWKICCGSGWVNCSSMLSQCQSAMLYAITGWRFQHEDLRSWGQPTNRPFARWWFQIVVVWLWTYMNIKCVYIYTSLYILLAILFDKPGIICVFWTGSVGMSSTCGAGSMHPGWPLLGSSSEMLVTFTGLDYCTFFPMLFPFSNTDIITYIYIYIPCIYTMFDRSCKSWIYINYCLTVRKKNKKQLTWSHRVSYRVIPMDGTIIGWFRNPEAWT